MLLACVIAFFASYEITYLLEKGRLERESAAQNKEQAQTTPTPNTAPQTNGTSSSTSTEERPDNKPEPEVTFASIQEIVDYVDALNLDYSNLASFDMSPYFKAVTLDETADAGEAYRDETVYIGDSLVLHMRSRSNHPREMVYSKESINPEDAISQDLTTLKDGTPATFAEAMAQLQPKRIVISIGTNSLWMSPFDYLNFFSIFIDQLKAACPNAEIILQSTPPVDADWEAGKSFSNNKTINRFNLYLAGLASYHHIWFLDSAPELKNASGTLAAEYNNGDGFHISKAAYDVWENYLRTHATTLQP